MPLASVTAHWLNGWGARGGSEPPLAVRPARRRQLVRLELHRTSAGQATAVEHGRRLGLERSAAPAGSARGALRHAMSVAAAVKPGGAAASTGTEITVTAHSIGVRGHTDESRRRVAELLAHDDDDVLSLLIHEGDL